MKPSEFIQERFILAWNTHLEEDLDEANKRFIDKEELKKMLEQTLKWRTLDVTYEDLERWIDTLGGEDD